MLDSPPIVLYMRKSSATSADLNLVRTGGTCKAVDRFVVGEAVGKISAVFDIPESSNC